LAIAIPWDNKINPNVKQTVIGWTRRN